VTAAGRPGRLPQWWLDLSVRAKGMIAVAFPLIALIAVTAASLVLQHSERQERTPSVRSRGTTRKGACLSAEAEPGVIRSMRGSGVVAYLTKPLNLTELGKLVDCLTAGHGQRTGPGPRTTPAR